MRTQPAQHTTLRTQRNNIMILYDNTRPLHSAGIVFFLCCTVLLLGLPTPLAAKRDAVLQGTNNDQLGGRYLTAQGTVNALVIFAQFPDDSLDVDHKEWPKDQLPARFHTWIDSVWTDQPTPFSMTDYFDQMSLGTYRFIGKTRYVVAPRTRKDYMERGMNRGDVHRDILAQLDKTMDFAEFDHWDPEGEYKHIERPDGIVDMVIVIWRNILDDIPEGKDKDDLRAKMDFTWDIEDLGYGDDAIVDNGERRVKMYFGMEGTTPMGSGLTLRKPPTRIPFMSVMQTCIHEVAHYLLGWNEYHAGFGFWGMLSAYGIRSYVANSFERHRLGWIHLATIKASDSLTLSNVALPDFVTTGIAYRFVIDSASGQYFYLENHQRLSRWDTPSNDTSERGLYVIRQDNTVDTSDPIGKGDHMRLITAAGRYDWQVLRSETHSCCGSHILPVFKQLRPNRHTGYHHCEPVPFISPDDGKQYVSDILLIDKNNVTTLDVRWAGKGYDAFRPGLQAVFSPWSNPNSQDKYRDNTGFGFEVIGTRPTPNGDVVLLNIHARTAVEASPALMQGIALSRYGNNPLLSWQPNEEPDVKEYRIYRAYTPSVQRPDDENFGLAATLPAKDAQGIPTEQWVDTDISLTGNGDKRHYYSISAVDSSNKESEKALGWIGYNPTSFVDNAEVASTAPFVVYPNPARGFAMVQLRLGTPSSVAITLSTPLGDAALVLRQHYTEAGWYSIPLDLSAIPVGVYAITVQTNEYTTTRMMVHLGL